MGYPPNKCWAPCFVLNSGYVKLKIGSRIIALYTALLHVLVFFYAVDILKGGRSDTFFSPLFEFSRYGMNVISIVLLVYTPLYLLCGSWWLVRGIRTEIRFYYLPWLWATMIEILGMVAFGIFMVYRYYHNVSKFVLKHIEKEWHTNSDAIVA